MNVVTRIEPFQLRICCFLSLHALIAEIYLALLANYTVSHANVPGCSYDGAQGGIWLEQHEENHHRGRLNRATRKLRRDNSILRGGIEPALACAKFFSFLSAESFSLHIKDGWRGRSTPLRLCHARQASKATPRASVPAAALSGQDRSQSR